MTSWVRLWHDMPTDPKFRTIARASGQPLASVIAVFTFMLVDASTGCASRGRVKSDNETIASALDLHEFEVAAIRAAMHGRILSSNSFIDKRFLEPLRPSRQEWEALRAYVFERDNYTCTYCGERGGRLECDHIEPVARGGSSDPENLTTSCFSCNRSKRDKQVFEWRSI